MLILYNILKKCKKLKLFFGNKSLQRKRNEPFNILFKLEVKL